MTRTLFAIGDDLQALANLMDECEAELGPEVDAALTAWFNELAGDEAVKLDGYVGLIRTWEMESAAAKAEADQYAMKARTRDNRVARLKERMKEYLDFTGRKKVETATKRTIAIQANGGAVPVEYLTNEPCDVLPPDMVIVTRRPDTDAVRKALAEGSTFPGIVLGTRGTHLRIR